MLISPCQSWRSATVRQHGRDSKSGGKQRTSRAGSARPASLTFVTRSDSWWRDSESCAGYWQPIDLYFDGATFERRGSETDVYDGSLLVDEKLTENMLRIPLRRRIVGAATGSPSEGKATKRSRSHPTSSIVARNPWSAPFRDALPTPVLHAARRKVAPRGFRKTPPGMPRRRDWP